MTEDDTFVELSRPSFRELANLFAEWRLKWGAGPAPVRMYASDRDRFFKSHNWTVREYHETWCKEK